MKNEVREKMNQLGTRILQNARNELYLFMRFFDMALSQLSYEMNLQTFFVGTDGKKIHFHPRFVAERFEYNRVLVNRAYLHMVLHCIYRHLYQEEERDAELWNVACDMAVEYCIDGLDYRCVKKLATDYREAWYERLENSLKVVTAEGIYKILTTEPLSDEEFMKTQLEFLVDDHAFWKGQKKNPEGDQNSKQEQEMQQAMMEMWQEIAEKTATNLETFSKNIGNEAKGLLRSMKIANRKRYDYRAFLKKFAVTREVVQVDEDSFDYVYYTYGLQQFGNMPLIEALEYKETKKIEQFVIVIDTSGSCSGQLVQRFLTETVSMLLDSESFSKKVHIHILQCDNQIQEDRLITSMDELEQYKEQFVVKGFGGTDFRPAFEYVDKLQQDKELSSLKGMIYFTDGIGVYPKKRPNYDVAFVFVETDYTDKLVPPWAMKLVIEEE